MKRLALFLFLSMAVLARNDLIVPGKSLGPVPLTADHAQLEKICSGDPGVMDGVSGDSQSSELWALDKPREMMVLWAGKKIASIVIRGDRSVYHTREGISLGTSLKQLQKLNGRPFKLHSFEGDKDGLVSSWQGGKLAASLPGLKLRLTLRVPGYNKLTGDQKVALEKPGELSSDAAMLTVLNPTVTELELTR